MNYHKSYLDITNLKEEEYKIEKYEKKDGLINNRAIYEDEVYILNNEIVNIKTRSNKKIVGILYMDSITQYGTNNSGNPIYLCKPLNPKYEHFYVASGKKEKVRMYVVFEFKEWNETQRLPHGQVVEYLGKLGEEETEYEMLRYYHELNFNRWRLEKEELIEKNNLLNLIKEDSNIDYEVFSIDPIGSIDIDDAFHYKDLSENKFEIGIHIASPTKYFDKVEDWIKILTERISTVYLIHKKYNVLPNELSDDLCSLLENKIRFGMSIIYEYEKNENKKIELKNWYFRESIIKNRKNYRYEDVDDMIEKEFKKGDKEMKKMYNKTKEIFDITELDSHKYVELWMIKTNEMVAKHLVKTLEDPSRTILRVCLPYKKSLKENELFDNQKVKKYMERKEMKSAIYKYYKENEYMGHSMMNLDLYTHFTSPIRRSVDFYIHLLLLNKNVEKYDLDKVNAFMKRTRRLDRDLKRMNYIFKMKKNEVQTQVKGYLMEMNENYIKVYIPDYEMEEKYFIKDRIGYSSLKKIEYEFLENSDNKIINKIKIDDKEYNLYEERDIKIWVFSKEDNFYRKLKIDII